MRAKYRLEAYAVLHRQDFQHAVYLGFGVVEVRTETNVMPAFSVLPGRTHDMLRGQSIE